MSLNEMPINGGIKKAVAEAAGSVPELKTEREEAFRLPEINPEEIKEAIEKINTLGTKLEEVKKELAKILNFIPRTDLPSEKDPPVN